MVRKGQFLDFKGLDGGSQITGIVVFMVPIEWPGVIYKFGYFRNISLY